MINFLKLGTTIYPSFSLRKELIILNIKSHSLYPIIPTFPVDINRKTKATRITGAPAGSGSPDKIADNLARVDKLIQHYQQKD